VRSRACLRLRCRMCCPYGWRLSSALSAEIFSLVGGPIFSASFRRLWTAAFDTTCPRPFSWAPSYLKGFFFWDSTPLVCSGPLRFPFRLAFGWVAFCIAGPECESFFATGCYGSRVLRGERSSFCSGVPCARSQRFLKTFSSHLYFDLSAFSGSFLLFFCFCPCCLLVCMGGLRSH